MWDLEDYVSLHRPARGKARITDGIRQALHRSSIVRVLRTIRVLKLEVVDVVIETDPQMQEPYGLTQELVEEPVEEAEVVEEEPPGR